MPSSWLGARLVDVPDALAPVRSIDAESEGGHGGLSPAAKSAIWAAVEALYRTGAYPAITFCLRRRGELVFNRALGHASGNGPADPSGADKRLATPDTPVCIFSASKAVTALLVHKLAEEGGIDLDQRLSYYLPEFAAEGKRETTVAQVLAHRGGFPMFNLPADERDPERLLDWDDCLRVICAAPPTTRSGERLAYHAITGGFVLGELIRRVADMPLTEYLDTRLRQPLGMDTFTFGLDAAHRERAARNYAAGQPVRFPISTLLEKALSAPFEQVIEVSNSDVFFDAVIPAGNLYCTAEELSRFYQMLLDGGQYQGKRVFEPATIDRAVRPANRLRFDRTLNLPMRYSEGLMLGADPFGLYGPKTGAAYGHLGFMNILGWADPPRQLSAGLLVTGKAVLGGHLLALGKLLTTIARRCG